MFVFDYEAVAGSGISVNGIPQLNLMYEFAGRTLVMALISIFVLITQNPRYFLIVLLMNILREGTETIIFMILCLLLPNFYIPISIIFGILCLITFFSRVVVCYKEFI